MFQHSALPAPTLDLPHSLPRIRILRGLMRLDELIPLPQTLKGYLIFLLVAGIITGLAVLQVWTSLQITKAYGELEALQVQHSLIEQQNAELLWQIGQHTTLARVQERAVALGYGPALQRKYIFQEEPVYASAPLPAVPPPPTQQESLAAAAPTGPEIGPRPPAQPGTLPANLTLSIENPLPGWQQQAGESWRGVQQWAAPLLDAARDLLLGRLSRPAPAQADTP